MYISLCSCCYRRAFATPLIKRHKCSWINKSTANFRIDHFIFDYKDFRNALLIDPSAGVAAGAEPLYSVQLNVMQLYLSVFY